MERTNELFIQQILDKYNIIPRDVIGYDCYTGMYVTASELVIKFIRLRHIEQNAVFCKVIEADKKNVSRDEMLIVLFDVFCLINYGEIKSNKIKNEVKHESEN